MPSDILTGAPCFLRAELNLHAGRRTAGKFSPESIQLGNLRHSFSSFLRLPLTYQHTILLPLCSPPFLLSPSPFLCLWPATPPSHRLRPRLPGRPRQSRKRSSCTSLWSSRPSPPRRCITCAPTSGPLVGQILRRPPGNGTVFRSGCAPRTYGQLEKRCVTSIPHRPAPLRSNRDGHGNEHIGNPDLRFGKGDWAPPARTGNAKVTHFRFLPTPSRHPRSTPQGWFAAKT